VPARAEAYREARCASAFHDSVSTLPRGTRLSWARRRDVLLAADERPHGSLLSLIQFCADLRDLGRLRDDLLLQLHDAFVHVIKELPKPQVRPSLAPVPFPGVFS
jgi:hypothetical protein